MRRKCRISGKTRGPDEKTEMEIDTIKIVAIVLTLLSCGKSKLVVADGNDMLSNCQAVVRNMDGTTSAAHDYFPMGDCLGFVQGVHQTISVLQSMEQSRLDICMPDSGIENGQATRIFVKYLTNHPEVLHFGEATLMILALGDAFPCE